MTSTHAPDTSIARGHHAPIAVAPATGRRPDSRHRLVRGVGLVFAVAGLAFGLAAFAYQPLISGAIGIALGAAGKHAGSRVGRFAVAVAVLGTILGPVFGATVYAVLTTT